MPACKAPLLKPLIFNIKKDSTHLLLQNPSQRHPMIISLQEDLISMRVTRKAQNWTARMLLHLSSERGNALFLTAWVKHRVRLMDLRIENTWWDRWQEKLQSKPTALTHCLVSAASIWNASILPISWGMGQHPPYTGLEEQEEKN